MTSDTLFLAEFRARLEGSAGAALYGVIELLLDELGETRRSLADECRRELEGAYTWGSWRPKEAPAVYAAPKVPAASEH